MCNENVVINKHVYDELLEALSNISNKLETKKIYTNEDVRKLLSVNDKLIRKYRNDGLLTYSCICNKFYYSSTDIRDFLSRTHLRNY